MTVAWLAAAPCAFAQDVAPPATSADTKKPADGETAPVNVTVKGHKKPVKPADRDVYDVSKDPATQTGTIADVLQKIPGVVVDPAGHLTLHGKSVTLLVDGRPSLILSGDNQGAALKAMPSNFITSVEVMTSPGAQYSSEGSGGVINLVTNRHMPPGGMLSLSAQASSTGGDGFNSFGSYHAGRLTVEGSVFDTRNLNRSKSASTLAEIDGSGNATQTTQNRSISNSDMAMLMVSGHVQYELTHDDILSGKIQVMDSHDHGRMASQSDSFGTTTNIFTAVGTNSFDMDRDSLDIDWVHYGKLPDQTLTVSASLSRSTNTMVNQTTDSYILSSLADNTGDRTTAFSNASRDDGAVVQVDYAGPLWDDQIHLGVQVQSDRNDSDNATHTPTPLTAVAGIVPLSDSQFNYHQTLSAVYVTYQKEFGDKWTVLGGLRAETLDLDTDFISLKSTGHLVYTRLNPSLFATYVISPKASVRFNYTRRLQRPAPQELNPYVILNSATSVNAGNPNLKPQDTDIYEARYVYTDGALNLTLRGFYNRDEHLISASSQFIPDPQGEGNQVLETTSRNFGFRDDTGLEVSFNNQLSKAISVMVDTTASQVRLRNPDVPGIQSARLISTSLNLNDTLSPKTGLYIYYNMFGRQPTGQGYMDPGSNLSLGLYHSLAHKLSLNITLSDLLRSGKAISVTDTTSIRDRSVTSHQAPTFMISLSRSFSHFGK